MMDRNRVRQLFAKVRQGSITPEEENELYNWLETHSPGKGVGVEDSISRGRDVVIVMPWRRLDWMAAAIILLIISLLWLLICRHHRNRGGVATIKRLADYRKAEGDAVLILGNDPPISLGQKTAGQLLNKDGIIAERVGKQRISLRLVAANNNLLASAPAVLLSVPYGQSWDVILADRTCVKLGPGTVFSVQVQSGKLQLDGEAYFEVAKDKSRPFMLTTTRDNIEAGGASFNVRSFSDESSSVATVVAGEVKLFSGGDKRLLLPGEEACVEQGQAGIRVVSGVDTTAELAWRNSYFSLTGMAIPAVMRQVQCWYGVTNVIYLPGVDTVTKGLLEGGHIGKDITLQHLLEELANENQLSLSIVDKTIIVGPLRPGLLHFRRSNYLVR